MCSHHLVSLIYHLEKNVFTSAIYKNKVIIAVSSSLPVSGQGVYLGVLLQYMYGT